VVAKPPQELAEDVPKNIENSLLNYIDNPCGKGGVKVRRVAVEKCDTWLMNKRPIC